MRIVYLHQYFVPPAGSGGTRSFEIGRRLVAMGHDVTMITSNAMMPGELKASKRIERFGVAGMSVVCIPAPYSNKLAFAARVRAFLKFALAGSYHALTTPGDVVLATSTPLTVAIPGIVASKLRGRPMVFEVRDLWPELPIAIGVLRNTLLKILARGLELAAYRCSREVIALSPGMADGVAARGVPRERITVIPNSCDISLFSATAEQADRFLAEFLPGLGGRPIVLYAGTFGLINGVSYLVEVAREMKAILPKVCFVLAGEGAEREKVIQLAENYEVLGLNLKLIPPVPKRRVPELFAAATVSTSVVIDLKELWNNSANKFFDALAAGRPVAINHEGWQADLIRKHGIGLVLPSKDHARAARLLADFISDPQRVADAGNAARRLALSEFDRDEMARRVERVLDRAI